MQFYLQTLDLRRNSSNNAFILMAEQEVRVFLFSFCAPVLLASSSCQAGFETFAAPTDTTPGRRRTLFFTGDETTKVAEQRRPRLGVPAGLTSVMSPPFAESACLGLTLSAWRGERKRRVLTSPHRRAGGLSHPFLPRFSTLKSA